MMIIIIIIIIIKYMYVQIRLLRTCESIDEVVKRIQKKKEFLKLHSMNERSFGNLRVKKLLVKLIGVRDGIVS